MDKPKKQNFPVPLDEATKNAAAGVVRARGFSLSESMRVFLHALIKQDKRAISILEEAKKK